MKKSELHQLIREEIGKALNDSKKVREMKTYIPTVESFTLTGFNENKTWKNLNQDDFEGKLENWKSSIVLSYDYIAQNDLYKVLDWIRTDEKTLNSKYPNIKYKINPGNRQGELPFIEINM